ncbi:MAG: hypothetical protein JWM65_2498 [Sphingomonas bacterium]|nr:hypothetical protein [Sphingomonas bacterium]
MSFSRQPSWSRHIDAMSPCLSVVYRVGIARRSDPQTLLLRRSASAWPAWPIFKPPVVLPVGVTEQFARPPIEFIGPRRSLARHQRDIGLDPPFLSRQREIDVADAVELGMSAGVVDRLCQRLSQQCQFQPRLWPPLRRLAERVSRLCRCRLMEMREAHFGGAGSYRVNSAAVHPMRAGTATQKRSICDDERLALRCGHGTTGIRS